MNLVVTKTPPSLKTRLISRTVGTDHIVDETYLSFRHTQEMPWILPGVPPTGRTVEIVIVNIVTIRGGEIVHKNVYWDQASVLVQVGLLDPKLVPTTFQNQEGGSNIKDNTENKHGIERLPVLGPESAGKALDEWSQKSNLLLDGT